MLFFEHGEVMVPSGLEEDWAEFLTSAAPRLGGVAVRTEGDHLRRVIGTAEGQVVYVVDLQNWLSTDSNVPNVAGAARVSQRPSLRRRTARRASLDRMRSEVVRSARTVSRFRQKMPAREQRCL